MYVFYFFFFFYFYTFILTHFAHNKTRQDKICLIAEGKLNAGRHLSYSSVSGTCSTACDIWCSMLLDADTVTVGCR